MGTQARDNKRTIDITKNVLVPNHKKLSKAQVKELLDRYNIELEDLPKIFIKDPAIQKLNPVVGDVIRIERSSPTAGKSIYYRVVING